MTLEHWMACFHRDKKKIKKRKKDETKMITCQLCGGGGGGGGGGDTKTHKSRLFNVETPDGRDGVYHDKNFHKKKKDETKVWGESKHKSHLFNK